MAKLINEVLQKIRKEHKLSRGGIENLSGFKERTVASYERGERDVSKEYLRFTSLYFNVSEDYILGKKDYATFYHDLKRVFLMYQDIYNYDENKMIEIFKKNNIDYFELLEQKNYKRFSNVSQILKICRVLKIKPSSFDLTIGHVDIENISYFEDNSNTSDIQKELLEIEQIGLFIDKDYYAKVIKTRNQQIKNYTPMQKTQKLEPKYQKVIDLLPYASDKFLNDIHGKLKAMKELQTL